MDALELERVEDAGRVADEHDAVGVRGRHGPPAAFRDRLRPIADHRAAADEARHARVHLELLELRVRFELRVLVVEPHHEADIPDVAAHRIDEAAAERRVNRKSTRLNSSHPSISY